MVAKRYYGDQIPYNGKPCIRGHKSARYAKGKGCIECQRERNTRSCAENKEARSLYQKEWKNKNREYANKRRNEYAIQNPIRIMLASAKAALKAKNVTYDLLESDITIPNKCPVLGIELKRGEGERTSNSPSLDRITPSLGYVKDNVLVVSWRANRIKADASVEELKLVSQFYSALEEQKCE